MIIGTTYTKELDKKTIKDIVSLTMMWCSHNMGVNNRRKFKLSLSVRKQRKKTRMGEYQPINNQLTVFYDNCPVVKDLVTTTIHEYTHYLQPITTQYYKLYKEFGYDDHPMEIEAVDNEQRLYDICWEQLSPIIMEHNIIGTQKTP